MRDFNDFDSISIKLASPEKIREWSYGEVKKPETINYRTLKPERDGLFCERIFGTTKEYECYCGKFKSIRYKGVVCDRCGVEVTHYKVRRERMGHIELAAPVSHIWYYRSVPSRMGLLLDMTLNSLKSVLYFERYVVIEPGESDLNLGDLLSEEDYQEYAERYGDTFVAGIGAAAIKEMLQMIDLDAEAQALRQRLLDKRNTSDKKLVKRLEVLEAFRDSGNRPEWMILEVVPVIPPELRPMVQLDGGRFATSDLNDLYRRVINRNNRLKRLQLLKAPEIIVRNEKRMLQEAVDALFDNSRRKRAVKGKGNRPLKSLSDMLKGKTGRFRQNLLGKRVDYSGRSVIVAGPYLKMHQCGLPKKMALELFKPFIMKRVVDKGYVYNIKSAKRLVESEKPEVFEVLEEVVSEHPVLLNRAPTLHRLGIQAFEPILVEGKAIRLHPLVCSAFNADFDGDQMAVHVPLSPKAQLEAWLLMLSAHNLLNPANGHPIVTPTQDIVLGIYYLTSERKFNEEGRIKSFSSMNELLYGLDKRTVNLQERIKLLRDNGKLIETTPGRVILQDVLPEDFPTITSQINNKDLGKIVSRLYTQYGPAVTVETLDKIKELGYRYATVFAPTISSADIEPAPKKKDIIAKANDEVLKIDNQYRNGVITGEEKYNKVIDVWTQANENVASDLFKHLEFVDQGFNSIYMMAQSGARGSKQQIRQLAGMRGLMAKPNGEIIEIPIKSNFKEGLTVLEYFISTNGARKGLADTALKTADAGYLTRRLVDIAQDVVVNEDDCGTEDGIVMTATKDGDRIIVPLVDKIVGRHAGKDILDPNTDEIVCSRNQEIDQEIAEKIESLGIDEVFIRSVLTCETRQGVCATCYGRNLATGERVNIGEAVGIIAAQSIGQPGTQLTMRTFHIGGTADAGKQEKDVKTTYRALITSIPTKIAKTSEGKNILLRRSAINIRKVVNEIPMSKVESLDVQDGQAIVLGEQLGILKSDAETEGAKIRAEENGMVHIVNDKLYLLGEEVVYQIRVGSDIKVDKNQIVENGSVLAEFDPFFEPVLTDVTGKVEFADLITGQTIREEKDETSGAITRIIMSAKGGKLTPTIRIHPEDGEIREYLLPNGAVLNIFESDEVEAGTVLAKIPRKASKTKDITGGLPRVAELFEARVPKDACTLAEIEGTVEFGGVVKDKRVILIKSENGEEKKYSIPQRKHLLVQPNDYIYAGDPLDDGPIDPHSILDIKGILELQTYLVREVQDVYRVQGVNINDKHIEIIIRQMLRKRQITDPGDTNFVVDQQIDRFILQDENHRVEEQGGKPASAKPVLLGLIKASLNTESFISAASFQETTKVLTDSAIKAKVDNLVGLKENVIIGHLIPAGTGLRAYHNIDVYYQEPGDLERMAEEVQQEEEVAVEQDVEVRPDIAVSTPLGEGTDVEKLEDSASKELEDQEGDQNEDDDSSDSDIKEEGMVSN